MLQEALGLSDDLQADEPKAVDDHKDQYLRPMKTTRVPRKIVKESLRVRRSDRLKKKTIS